MPALTGLTFSLILYVAGALMLSWSSAKSATSYKAVGTASVSMKIQCLPGHLILQAVKMGTPAHVGWYVSTPVDGEMGTKAANQFSLLAILVRSEANRATCGHQTHVSRLLLSVYNMTVWALMKSLLE